MENGCQENNLFKKLVQQSDMEFNYEVSSVKFLNPDDNKQIFFLDKVREGKNYGINFLINLRQFRI